ncbi:MAG: hypothetical protein DRR16_09305 [Candidatus Parabeggiatoa sp. nov. 3]|nr:MAG: hypothetical protein DRR00_21320 [Gammaproteobacteria bacterium]RKZ64770.1 MAG: hypothetical protein DRQ99_14640 [Gammaproteobacteria bacterium]RKZ86562.1 MAG: hypothetical protein DRR16_09305 [Gammaproteobacteria bacterium]
MEPKVGYAKSVIKFIAKASLIINHRSYSTTRKGFVLEAQCALAISLKGMVASHTGAIKSVGEHPK